MDRINCYWWPVGDKLVTHLINIGWTRQHRMIVKPPDDIIRIVTKFVHDPMLFSWYDVTFSFSSNSTRCDIVYQFGGYCYFQTNHDDINKRYIIIADNNLYILSQQPSSINFIHNCYPEFLLKSEKMTIDPHHNVNGVHVAFVACCYCFYFESEEIMKNFVDTVIDATSVHIDGEWDDAQFAVDDRESTMKSMENAIGSIDKNEETEDGPTRTIPSSYTNNQSNNNNIYNEDDHVLPPPPAKTPYPYNKYKKPPKPKDLKTPKKNQSSYFLFSNDRRLNFRQKIRINQ